MRKIRSFPSSTKYLTNLYSARLKQALAFLLFSIDIVAAHFLENKVNLYQAKVLFIPVIMSLVQ